VRSLGESVKRIVRRFVIDLTNATKSYPCTVESQAFDGTLALRPDDNNIRGNGLDGVPLRVGLPGFKVKVPNGCRVMLSYENGDPSRPYASLFEQSTGYKIDVGTLLVGQNAATFVVAVQYVPPGPNDIAHQTQVASTVAAMLSAATPIVGPPIELEGLLRKGEREYDSTI